MLRPPTLSELAKRRLQAVEFSLKRGAPLAREAFEVSRATIYAWRKRYNPDKLEKLEDCPHWMAVSMPVFPPNTSETKSQALCSDPTLVSSCPMDGAAAAPVSSSYGL